MKKASVIAPKEEESKDEGSPYNKQNEPYNINKPEKVKKVEKSPPVKPLKKPKQKKNAKNAKNAKKAKVKIGDKSKKKGKDKGDSEACKRKASKVDTQKQKEVRMYNFRRCPQHYLDCIEERTQEIEEQEGQCEGKGKRLIEFEGCWINHKDKKEDEHEDQEPYPESAQGSFHLLQSFPGITVGLYHTIP